MNTGILLSALALVAGLSTLTTEGIKKILDEMGKTYKSNLLAGIVAIILSIGAVLCYVLYFGNPFTVQTAVILVCFAYLSWLAAMASFDKVKQLIEQFNKKEN